MGPLTPEEEAEYLRLESRSWVEKENAWFHGFLYGREKEEIDAEREEQKHQHQVQYRDDPTNERS